MSETATLTISEFLKERLREEEETWGDVTNEAVPFGRQGWRKLAAFMLEDIMSKRAIVDLHRLEEDCGTIGCVICDNHPYEGILGGGGDGPCATLRLLAAPYRRHESYREEWA